MANAKGSANVRNIMLTGKSPLLPPKVPFPGTSPAYSDYSSSNTFLGSKGISRPKDFMPYHQRTSSESVLVEEQPSWLDDLLDEPETPVRRGHRRSSSDSFAYTDMACMSNMDSASTLQNESKYKNIALSQLWGPQNTGHYKDVQQGSFFADSNSYGKPRSNTVEWPLNSATHPGTLLSLRENRIRQSAGSWSTPQKGDPHPPIVTEKQDGGEPGHPDANPLPENDSAHAKMASENDTKRAKQQFAQRSRVRKLQYIAELERNVQALQAEGSEASAELEFLSQQKLITSMENKALKQRLESMAQEQLIKHLEHEVLEREIGRLRALYQQQQSHQQPHQRQFSTTHKRSSSKDFDSQFANLSLKHKDASSGADTIRT